MPGKSRLVSLCDHLETVLAKRKKTPHPTPTFLVGCFLTSSLQASFHRDLVETDILDCRPDNGEATGLCREHINLIGALAHIALRDFQWRWWSECADACLAGTRKR